MPHVYKIKAAKMSSDNNIPSEFQDLPLKEGHHLERRHV
jgi:hypothetical protein